MDLYGFSIEESIRLWSETYRLESVDVWCFSGSKSQTA